MLSNRVAKIVLISILMVVFMSGAVLAHCIWVEVPGEVALGEEYEVLAFYAHPDDPMEERDMTELSLYALSPDGTMTALNLIEKATYQQAVIPFSQEGQWLLILIREPHRYRLQEIRDFGKSIVQVGGGGGRVHEPVGLSLEILIVSEEEGPDGLLELILAVQYEGSSVQGAEIEIFRSLLHDSTLYEGVDELKTDGQGQLTVVIDPQYRYVFEADHRVPAREVEDVRRFITEVRFRSTLFLGN